MVPVTADSPKLNLKGELAARPSLGPPTENISCMFLPIGRSCEFHSLADSQNPLGSLLWAAKSCSTSAEMAPTLLMHRPKTIGSSGRSTTSPLPGETIDYRDAKIRKGSI